MERTTAPPDVRTCLKPDFGRQPEEVGPAVSRRCWHASERPAAGYSPHSSGKLDARGLHCPGLDGLEHGPEICPVLVDQLDVTLQRLAVEPLSFGNGLGQS